MFGFDGSVADLVHDVPHCYNCAHVIVSNGKYINATNALHKRTFFRTRIVKSSGTFACLLCNRESVQILLRNCPSIVPSFLPFVECE
jgi:hypothetical protein